MGKISLFFMVMYLLLLPLCDSLNDSEYLLSIKNSIQVDSLSMLSDWEVGKHYCTWYGVTCDANNVTISLNISGASLSGKLSVDVGRLTELRVLSLADNAFYGEIPKEIGNLMFLQVLELQGNNFTGEIPGELFNNNHELFNLRLLNLSYNMLNGVVPKGLIGYGRIRVLDLSYNELSGGIKVDVSTRCESLEVLRLSGNFLVNRIPPGIGNCSNLRELLVDENVLEGRIPVEIGNIKELRILDVSRNSLTGRVPKELGNCSKLEVVVLTNLLDGGEEESGRVGEFNAFVGGIPFQVMMLPNLEVFWAPRANLGGRLVKNWRDSCKLRVLNLGQNYIAGIIPKGLGLCKNLSFLDLSSNVLHGFVPSQLHVPCMVYFNVSHNSLSGSLPAFAKSNCSNSLKTFRQSDYFYEEENFEVGYSVIPLWSSRINMVDMRATEFVVHHDFSRNNFTGSLPLFYLGDGIAPRDVNPSYRLLLNDNKLNGSLPGVLFTDCTGLESFAVDLSSNNISGGISQDLLFDCSRLIGFQAAYNRINGPIPSSIGSSEMLHFLDLRGNMLTGSLPYTLEKLNHLRLILLGGNYLVGEIPAQLGNLHLLTVLDLSRNALSESIPPSLANATNLQELLLDHNNLSGEVPVSFSTFAHLTKLDVSYNNLSGHIPHLQHVSDCDGFKGNNFLQPCPDPNAAPSGLPLPLDIHKHPKHNSKLKTIVIALVSSASVIVLVFLITIVIMVFRRKKLGLARISSLKSKVVVTFTEVPAKLNYDNVVRATGNFSVRNLIGTGGFGATYKAELAPGFLVAVKRLAIGRFQGIQQFDAEIRTLGRIKHKNLVTLIGYYMGETEMFLIYNYLSGGNLQTFIHERSGENVKWPVIHKIALDIAQSLTYLHYYCVPRIVHRDIKPSNILLDEDLNAYLSDFGLARLLEVSETHATTDVAGTFGYVAPEYATTCRVSDKADVYSFGVVLLELLSGKKCLDLSFSNYGNGFNIVAWGNLLINEGRSSEFFYPELWEVGPRENLLNMLSLASDCTVESLSVRPSMKQVLTNLKQLKIPES
ncbi:hypothetical protein MKW94_026884 [Papaver nudicaule]|uniref:non-specific serine/threonine protein kinase n=1 Tax=Papaver nudicaule TaxID=74823 RepID=A0AA41VZ74_PAPNU|nr:hypothetical protein [Papaver nudicaule]